MSKRNMNAIMNPGLTSKEISSRKVLVDWMCDVGDRYTLPAESIHKAVFYYDKIIAENYLKDNEIKPIALICMLLAVKLTEDDRVVNNIASLFRKTIGSHKLNIMQYEIQVMRQLNWDLQHVTTIDFIKSFIVQGVVFSSDIAVNEKSVRSLRQYAEFFADMCLQECEFISVDSLVLAAGIIAAARKILAFQKIWNKELEELVAVKREDAEKYAELILYKYGTLFPKNNHNKAVSSSLKSNTTTQHSLKRYI